LLLLRLPAQADRLTEQRRQYDQARAALERGDLERFNSLRSALTDYPLYPYLGMEPLRKSLDRAPRGAMAPIRRCRIALPAASSIKATWLKRLRAEGDWPRLRRHLDADSLTAELECPLVLQDWNEGKVEQARERARELWTVGHSQPDACTPLFERWRAS